VLRHKVISGYYVTIHLATTSQSTPFAILFTVFHKLEIFRIFSLSVLCLIARLVDHMWLYAMFQKLWFQHVWPCLQQEMKTQEVLAAVLEPVISLVQECTSDEYESIILPSFRYATCACACVCVCVCTAQYHWSTICIFVHHAPLNSIKLQIESRCPLIRRVRARPLLRVVLRSESL